MTASLKYSKFFPSMRFSVPFLTFEHAKSSKINLEQFSSTSMKNCKCTEPCDTMKYHAYLSYGAFPGEEAAKVYSNNSEELQRSFR